MAYSYDRTASVEKEATEEIQLDQLPADRMKIIEDAEQMGFTPMKVWEGVHGYIVECNVTGPQNTRLTKDMLKKLLRHSKFRWIDVDERRTSIGM